MGTHLPRGSYLAGRLSPCSVLSHRRTTTLPAMRTVAECLRVAERLLLAVTSVWLVGSDHLLGPLKWGVGKLIADCEVTPVVVPFYHRGMEEVCRCLLLDCIDLPSG